MQRKIPNLPENKMFNLGIYGSHNCAFALGKDDEVLEVIELERLLNKKNEGMWFWGHHDNDVELLLEVHNYFKNKYGVVKYANVIYNAVEQYEDKGWWPLRQEIFPALNYEHCLHHQSHAYSAFYQSSYEKALIVSFDGGSDEMYFNVYFGDKKSQTPLAKVYQGAKDYAVSYMTPAHFINDIKIEDLYQGNLVYAGKIMGLAAYGNVREEYIQPFIDFYNHNQTDNIAVAAGKFIKLFEPFGIKILSSTNPSDSYELQCARLGSGTDATRLTGKDAWDLATTNQYVFEKLFFEEMEPFLNQYKDYPVVLVGGCALNILNNTRLAQTRDVFVPPNPNDCGQAVGLLCSKIRPSKPVDCTYIGPEVWDRNDLARILEERRGFTWDTSALAEDIINGKIIGIVRGRSEHGPRALGNRSIICDPMIKDMKDILNQKVKGREYYRPFAPIVRLEDVNKFFEWDRESRFMSFCPKVRQEYRTVLPAITHVDGTARVQTVTREQNEFLYDLLTELDKKRGVGVLLNTSFNIAGKPILNTYRDALWVLDNKQMDSLILEDYIIKKN